MAKKSSTRSDFTQLEVLATGLKKLADSKYKIRVGLFGDKSARPKDKQQGSTNAEIGFIQEMGSVSLRIPRRSFLLDTFTNHGDKLMQTLAPFVDSLFMNGKVDEYLKKCGIACTNLVLEAFDTSGWGSWAPNAPATIEAKGSAQPLWDTGQMAQAISSRTVRS